MMSIGSENTLPPSVCKGCQFALHCGCCYDEHEYKMENCDYYALAHRYNLMSAQFDKLMVRITKREGARVEN